MKQTSHFTPNSPDRSIGDLVKELSSETGALLRDEVALAKAELGVKTGQIASQTALFISGFAFAVIAIVCLVVALCIGLQELFEQFMGFRETLWVAPLVVAFIVAALAYTVIRKSLNLSSSVGSKTVDPAIMKTENDAWLTNQA